MAKIVLQAQCHIKISRPGFQMSLLGSYLNLFLKATMWKCSRQMFFIFSKKIEKKEYIYIEERKKIVCLVGVEFLLQTNPFESLTCVVGSSWQIQGSGNYWLFLVVPSEFIAWRKVQQYKLNVLQYIPKKCHHCFWKLKYL